MCVAYPAAARYRSSDDAKVEAFQALRDWHADRFPTSTLVGDFAGAVADQALWRRACDDEKN